MDRINFDSFNFVSVTTDYLSSEEEVFGEVLLIARITDDGEVILRRSGSDAGINRWNTRESVGDVEYGLYPTRRWVEEEVYEDLNAVLDEEPDSSFLDEPNWSHLVNRKRFEEELVEQRLWELSLCETRIQLSALAKRLKRDMQDFLLRKEGKIYDDVTKDGVIVSFRKTGTGLSFGRWAPLMNAVTSKVMLMEWGKAPSINTKDGAKRLHEWVRSHLGSEFGFYHLEHIASTEPKKEEESEGSDCLDHVAWNVQVTDAMAIYEPEEEGDELDEEFPVY